MFITTIKVVGEEGCLNEARELKAQGTLLQKDKLETSKNHSSQGNDFISPMQKKMTSAFKYWVNGVK
jgi:hypothetical protein